MAAVHDVHPAFTVVLALAVGVFSQSLARHLRIPGIVLLLVAGVGLGPDGLGWVAPAALGDGLQTIVQLAVAIILFEGGLNLEIRRLRREQSSIQRLVTLGALVTAAGGAVAVLVLFGWGLVQSMLFGALVVVTGPTVVGPLIADLRLRPRAATVLEAEGVLIDPIGAILAVVMLEIAIAPAGGAFAHEAGLLVLRLGFGSLVGAAAGFAMAGLLGRRRIVPEGHENIFALVSVLLLFQGADEVVRESGIVAVVVAGVVVGNQPSRFDRDLREFKDQLTVLMIGLLFVLLAAGVRLSDVTDLGWRGVGVVAVLIGIVRPLGVWLCTKESDLTRKERIFIAWIAPRGIVAAAVASVTAESLTAAGLPGGTEIRALVFLTIAITVTLAGLTALPLASLLDVRLPGRSTIAILGAQGLGLELGLVLRSSQQSVVFLDSNPQHCRQAEEAGFSVVFGNALQERTMQRARFGSVGAAVGLTSNQVLNSVFTERARENFQVPRGYIGVSQPGSGFAMELVDQRDARIVFDGPHDVERWDVRARRGELSVERWRYVDSGDREIDEEASATNETLVILAIERGKETDPMHSEFALRNGDIAIVAVYTPDRSEAHTSLGRRGFAPTDPRAFEQSDAPARGSLSDVS